MSVQRDMNDIHVVGVGLMCTGTERLKSALEVLYDKKCLRFKDCQNSEKDNKEDSQSKSAAVCYDDVFKDHLGIVDIPACFQYKDILKSYPKTKFVLTLIDEESWLKCVRKTLIPREATRLSLGYKVVDLFCPIGCQIDEIKTLIDEYLPDLNFNPSKDDSLRDLFRQHNTLARKSVPFDQFLIFKQKEGWETLCTFLGKQIPAQQCPTVDLENEEALVPTWKKSLIYSIDVGVPVFILTGIGVFIYKKCAN